MNENVKKVVARILKDIQVEMSDEFDKNFERQAFFSEKWQRRKSPIRNEGRAILTDTGALRKSIGKVGQRKTALPSLPLCPMRPFIMMAVK